MEERQLTELLHDFQKRDTISEEQFKGTSTSKFSNPMYLGGWPVQALTSPRVLAGEKLYSHLGELGA